MKSVRRRLFLVFLPAPVLAFAGGVLDKPVIMWIGTSLLGLLVLLCIIQILSRKDIIPTDEELLGRHS